MALRCPECRNRFVKFSSLTKHLSATGHALCYCDGYWHPHRPGSRCCERNPLGAVHLAERYGATEEELLEMLVDIVLDKPGVVGGPCPF